MRVKRNPKPSKVIDYLREQVGDISTSAICGKFNQSNVSEMRTMLRGMAATGLLIRTICDGRAFYRLAPSFAGLESLKMWQIKLPKEASSRIVRFA